MSQLLILGGGIAGSSLAYLAARAGHRVTLVDAGREASSSVPSALINPVRGQGGQVVERGLKGMRFTWSVLEDLEKQGFAVPHARAGVLRPVPDLKTFEKWQSRIPEDLPHHWLEVSDLAHYDARGQNLQGQNIKGHWFKVLEVSEGGWLDGNAFARSLREASGARVVKGIALEWTSQSVMLEDGTQLEADAVVWCGGSWGAARAGLSNPHRRGSVLLLEQPLSEIPVSFGIYSAPSAKGGVLGATYETPTPLWTPAGLPLKSLEWLLNKAAHTFQTLEPEFRGLWTGSRLGGEILCGPRADGSFILSGLGSKGFLLGPLLARDLLERMSL
jgi:glycine/D-amino acid oxidase-like deaminating enzyme